MSRSGLISWLCVGALLVACGGPSQPHPPPEGEWLEWSPKGQTKKAERAEVLDDDADGPRGKPAASAAVGTSPAPVACGGTDNVRDSVCIAKTDLGGGDCPATLSKKIGKETRQGQLEIAPDDAKRETSLEDDKHCCFAWCVKISAAPATDLKCKKNETAQKLVCFDAPSGGSVKPAAPPYADCPQGLKKTAKKGRKLGNPPARLAKSSTADARQDSPKACCYEACAK